MSTSPHKKHNKSLAGKIILTCLLACGAIFLSLYISKFTFSKILDTVDQLARPNTKIQLVNDLFRDVVKLDHLQRNQAIQTADTTYNPFIKESHHLYEMLDSLRGMSQQDVPQVRRIDSMKKILNRRDLLFLKYVKLHRDLVRNDTLATEVKNLSEMIDKARIGMDSNLVTTSRATKTTIDTVKQEEKKLSLWKRIFSRRKTQVKQVQTQVEEELKVRIDTVGLGNKGDSLAKIGKAISEVETNRISRRTQLRSKQAELNLTGDILITELISILNDIERDELANDMGQNAVANRVVNEGIAQISLVLIIFIACIVILILLIFSDISSSNKYRKQLIVAKEEAEEAGLVKQRFLANMSHELRTPLQTIIGVSEQIRAVREPKPQDLENIHQSSLHLLQIVNEVLDYSRIISGKYVLENKPFNMCRLLSEVKEMIQVQLALKQLRLKFDVSIPEGNYYSGDPFRLKQVLLNLLGNATKFTIKGGVSFSASARILPDGRSLFTFIVKDTGVGIAAADIQVIFNEFEQGTNSNRKPGTGLGLSIVKAMVDILQGTIKAESEPGTGTTFTCSIPYSRAEPIKNAPNLLPAVASYKGHIWLVDDDPFILQLCDGVLNKHNIAHTCFNSANEALATKFPDDLNIVFLDIRMAEMDGITLCNRLRERAVTRIPRYIAFTAQAFPDEQEAILKRGFDDLLVKPFLENDFINAIAGYSATSNNTSISLDLSAVHKMTGNDEQLLHLVLHSFITETEHDVATVRKSILNKDSYELAEALHKLAGRCGQLGAISLSHRLRMMEMALHEHKEISDVIAETDEVYAGLDGMIKAIKWILNEQNIPV